MKQLEREDKALATENDDAQDLISQSEYAQRSTPRHFGRCGPQKE